MTLEDWETLVSESGGTIDYGAIVRKHGGTIVEPQPDGQAESWRDSSRPLFPPDDPDRQEKLRLQRLLSPDDLRAMAEQGDARAQNVLGGMYEEGRDVPQDYAEAVRWFRLAANQGFAPAQFFLGNSLGLGRGVPQDHVEAHMWFNLAGAHPDLGSTDREWYVEARDAVEGLLTTEQVVEAQRLAREWKPTAPQQPTTLTPAARE